MKTCPRCGSKKLWYLSTEQIRCSQCGLTRKISKDIWKKKHISPYWKGRLIEYFCLGFPAYRLRFQVPYSQLTIQRCFRMFRGIIYQNVIKDLNRSRERLKWIKPCSVAGKPANEAGELPEKPLSLTFTRETGKSLLFLSLHVPERP